MTQAALRPVRIALAVLALTVLAAGCGSDKAEPACPRGVIPIDASKITRFRDGPGRDLTDVLVTGNIQNLLVDECKYDKDSVAINNFQIAITADRGPADRSRVADFEYWVAVVDPQRKVLKREAFKIHFDFADINHVGAVVADLVLRIPMADIMKAPEYQIVVGFQLTPDELAWNRSQRGAVNAQ